MYSGERTRALPRVGFPIRTSWDQRMVSSFPRLIAAAHVLHRLLAPRHPPCALILLIVKNTCFCHYGVFKVHAGRARRERTAHRTVSQNSTAWSNTEFDIVLGTRALDGDAINSSSLLPE